MVGIRVALVDKIALKTQANNLKRTITSYIKLIASSKKIKVINSTPFKSGTRKRIITLRLTELEIEALKAQADKFELKQSDFFSLIARSKVIFEF